MDTIDLPYNIIEPISPPEPGKRYDEKVTFYCDANDKISHFFDSSSRVQDLLINIGKLKTPISAAMVTLSAEDIAKAIEWGKKVAEMKAVEGGKDDKNRPRRYALGMMGLLVFAKFFEVPVPEKAWYIGHSRDFDNPDFQQDLGLSFSGGIKSVESYFAFPLLRDCDKVNCQVIVLKKDYGFYLIGVATPDLLKQHSGFDGVEKAEIKNKGKQAFVGIHDLVKVDTLEELKTVCQKYA